MRRCWPLLAACLLACDPGGAPRPAAGQELRGELLLYPAAYGPAAAPDVTLTLPLPEGERALRSAAKPARDVLLARGEGEPWARLWVQWLGPDHALVEPLPAAERVAAYGAALAAAAAPEGVQREGAAARFGAREGWLLREQISVAEHLPRVGDSPSNRGWVLRWAYASGDGLMLVYLVGYGTLGDEHSRWFSDRLAGLRVR